MNGDHVSFHARRQHDFRTERQSVRRGRPRFAHVQPRRGFVDDAAVTPSRIGILDERAEHRVIRLLVHLQRFVQGTHLFRQPSGHPMHHNQVVLRRYERTREREERKQPTAIGKNLPQLPAFQPFSFRGVDAQVDQVRLRRMPPDDRIIRAQSHGQVQPQGVEHRHRSGDEIERSNLHGYWELVGSGMSPSR